MAARLRRHHGKRCFWCKRPMLLESHALHPTRDHVIPKAQGGTIIRICCKACNNLKSDMHPSLWVLVLERRPDVLDRYARPGPRGMALFYQLFGEQPGFDPDRVAREAMNRCPQYGEVRL